MATVADVAGVLASALTEISINGEVDVTMDGSRSVTWIGQPSGDDLRVVVTVTPLERTSSAS